MAAVSIPTAAMCRRLMCTDTVCGTLPPWDEVPGKMWPPSIRETRVLWHLSYATTLHPLILTRMGHSKRAPLYMYVGTKDSAGDFLARNGLRDGSLYVLVPDDGTKLSPSAFHGAGNSQSAAWVEVDNARNIGLADTAGRQGYDTFGYPRQGNLFLQAKAAGAFGFSRPEDVHENPNDPTTVVVASTGVDTYDINPLTGNGADTWGTMYTITTDFTDPSSLTATLSIVYDGNQDKTRTIRSPDNLVWSPSGMICVQEDEAEQDTASGDEVLFSGPGVACNPNEAGIVCFDMTQDNIPVVGSFDRVANIDRRVLLDPTIATPEDAVDTDSNNGGQWESSGIFDVSVLFDKTPGTLYIVNVQAHGIEDQSDFNAESRLTDGDLVEGGQLLILELAGKNGKGSSKGKGAKESKSKAGKGKGKGKKKGTEKSKGKGKGSKH